MTQDQEEKLERVRSGLSAAQALVVGAAPGQRNYWARLEKAWQERIKELEAQVK